MIARPLSLAMLAVLALAVGLGASPADGASPAPGWTIHSLAIPTRFSTQDNARCLSELGFALPACDGYQVTATNAGSVATSQSVGITLSDTLPADVTVRRVRLVWSAVAPSVGKSVDEDIFPDLQAKGLCTISPVRCQLPPVAPYRVSPDESVEMQVYVTANEPGPHQLTNAASVSGGGAAAAATSVQNPLGGPLPSFGLSSVSAVATGPNGAPDVQAGDHPYEFTTRLDFNSIFRIGPDGEFAAQSVEDPRDVVVDLPVGFLGSALSTPRCTFAQLSSFNKERLGGCPTSTVVGHILSEPFNADEVNGPIYNMVPEHGVAAEFAFVDELGGSHVLYAKVVPSPNGYVLRTVSSEVPQIVLTDIVATFYGNPAAKNGSGAPAATFTNPGECSGQPLATAIHMDSWQHPGGVDAEGTPALGAAGWAGIEAATFPEGVIGCNLLQFAPSLSVQPEPLAPGAADSPTGLDVDMKLAQSEEPGVLATPPLRNASVTLPSGLTVDPSSAGGLEACSESQIGFAGFDAATSVYEFNEVPPSCPNGSKIGSVELSTPLLPGTLHGSIFLATEHQNPFGSLLAGYIVVDDAETGILVKIPGEIKADPSSGQITGVFDNNPQFPFDELKLHFKSGPRGALATPEDCGTYTTISQLTPWSAPQSGSTATPSDSFQISSGCVSGFAPSLLAAGPENPQAGGYSPLVLSFARGDGEQEISRATVTLPPGALAKIAGVARCSNAQIAAAAANPSGAAEAASPSCPAASQVGTVRAGAGPGPNPYFVSGKAYFAGPYNGAPFSLAVVVPAVAGPFDLGNVVVRTALRIDPTDGHVTAESDPFPTMINGTGIPVRLRRIDLEINRPEFTFNPTSCEPMTLSVALSSTRGASSTATQRLQAANCQGLPFAPSFSASTQGKTSKANGASLVVRVAQKRGEAGIRQVRVQLPLALPSRLTTIQKACTEAQFNANPAGCPEGSNVGTATAVTPVLSVPLTGPAYLVSHGAAAFPDLEFVLQGEGVTIVLDGKTDIKKGITYSRFETVPDAPISTFETNLPEGPHSVLTANTSLCAPVREATVKQRVSRRVHGHVRKVTVSVRKLVPEALVIPTTIVGQNGATVTQGTRIAVTGCPKAKAKVHRTSKKKPKRGAKKRKKK